MFRLQFTFWLKPSSSPTNSYMQLILYGTLNVRLRIFSLSEPSQLWSYSKLIQKQDVIQRPVRLLCFWYVWIFIALIDKFYWWLAETLLFCALEQFILISWFLATTKACIEYDVAHARWRHGHRCGVKRKCIDRDNAFCTLQSYARTWLLLALPRGRDLLLAFRKSAISYGKLWTSSIWLLSLPFQRIFQPNQTSIACKYSICCHSFPVTNETNYSKSPSCVEPRYPLECLALPTHVATVATTSECTAQLL